MDIKGLVRNVIPFTVTKSDEVKTKSALNTDNDREGNGQATSGEGEHKQRAPTPEEIEAAVEYLKNLPGVKDNSLTVKVEARDGITVVYIQDRDGKVVRRIPESELRALTANKEKKSGHLLNKAM